MKGEHQRSPLRPSAGIRIICESSRSYEDLEQEQGKTLKIEPFCGDRNPWTMWHDICYLPKLHPYQGYQLQVVTSTSLCHISRSKTYIQPPAKVIVVPTLLPKDTSSQCHALSAPGSWGAGRKMKT